jgi:hypothetical protein
MSGLILFGAMVASARAGGILANAQLTGVSLGRAEYAYTLTLNNTAASSSEIGMFWFAWAAGQADFLASEPTAVQTPAGWTGTVEGGSPGDGYSIQFVTFTAPLAPGSSVTFTFHSTDSPRIMGGPAALYPQYPTLMSQVYSGHAADGLQELFVAQLVVTDLGELAAKINSTNLVLTWTSGTNVVLQQSSKPSSTNWTTVAGTLGARIFTVTNFSGAAPSYYRLATQ